MRTRRRDVRFEKRLSVQVRMGGRSVHLVTEDVSCRGIFLRTDTPPPLGQVVPTRIPLPGRDTPFEAQGMAVHVVTHDNAQGRVPGVGLQFYALDQDARAEWEEFVRSTATTSPLASEQTPLTLLSLPLPVAPAPPAPLSSPRLRQEPVRRRAHRHQAVLRVRVETMHDLFEVYSRDVSGGGMFVATDVDLPRGNLVVVHVTHPQTGEVFYLQGIVRHRQSTPGLAGLGVEFLGPHRLDEFLQFARGSAHHLPEEDDDEDVA